MASTLRKINGWALSDNGRWHLVKQKEAVGEKSGRVFGTWQLTACNHSQLSGKIYKTVPENTIYPVCHKCAKMIVSL